MKDNTGTGEAGGFGKIMTEVKSFISTGWPAVKNNLVSMKDNFPMSGNDEDDARHLTIAAIKRLLDMIKAGQLQPSMFDLDVVKTLPAWQPLARVILASRVDELKRCKVVRHGKKVDVSGLKGTSIGKLILTSLGFDRRSILTMDEYVLVSKHIARLNYTPPMIIEPTSTERYFSDMEE